MKQLFVSLALLIGFFLNSSAALADDKTAAQKPTTMKVESALQTKIRSVATLLRCPVCQGESVYDSHSDVAVEMKRLIGDKLKAGQSTEEILTYFKDRYGNFILMEPPAEGLHWVIWVFPIFMALLGGMLLFQNLRASVKEQAEADKNRAASSAKTSQTASDVKEIEELHL